MLTVIDGADFAARGEVRTEVCVVGSGAGGAVVASGLAERGVAVVVLEEGRLWRAPDYPRDPALAIRRLYRDAGLVGSLGVPSIPIGMGRTVGGTTTVNAGTCLRPPAATLERWASQGLGFARDLPAYLDRVERDLHVAPVPDELLGVNGEVARRGAAALGYRGFPTPRNARGCRGEGACSWGCPHDAKLGTALTYLPRAAAAGAQVVARCRAERVRLRGGRAGEVEASALRPGGGRARVRVRADAIVLAGGAVPTPLLLLKSGLGNASGQVGRSLHLHPASRATGFFDAPIRGRPGVFQSYVIDEFAGDGILMETVLVPPSLLAPALPGVGEENAAWMRRFAHAALLGVMVADESAGRVRRGPLGAPLVTYRLGRRDVARLQRGIAETARVLLAAGAREVLVGVHGAPPLRSQRDVETLLARRVGAGDLELMSMHPHGSCRMGADPRASVVGPEFEAHGVPGLYLADASVLPTTLGVNPQLTIMALAARAAEVIAHRRGGRDRSVARPEPLW